RRSRPRPAAPSSTHARRSDIGTPTAAHRQPRDASIRSSVLAAPSLRSTPFKSRPPPTEILPQRPRLSRWVPSGQTGSAEGGPRRSRSDSEHLPLLPPDTICCLPPRPRPALPPSLLNGKTEEQPGSACHELEVTEVVR